MQRVWCDDRNQPSSGILTAMNIAIIGILIYLLVAAIVALVLYWIIRLGVRHGIMDAAQKSAAGKTGD